MWVKCKPYFSNKHSEVDANIAINEERDIIFLKKEIANTFHEYFGSVVESLSLDLHTWNDGLIKFINHPSIKTT